MDRLREIEERLASATPGPWEIGVVEPMPDGWPGAYAAVEPNIAGGLDPLDAELIAHAPADLAALVAVVREVEALHRPHVVVCLNPSHGKDCVGQVCDTCDAPWPCPTAAAVQKLGSGS